MVINNAEHVNISIELMYKPNLFSPMSKLNPEQITI